MPNVQDTYPSYQLGLSNVLHQPNKSNHSPTRVGIIGGGVAGSTIAIRLAALDIETYLFEQKTDLIDGPPMCHLHAGGNLYREILDRDCVSLLEQGIEMIRLYPHSIDIRPTVIAVPQRDAGDPNDLLPRLELLTKTYRKMVADNPANEVLGAPKDYYKTYNKAQMQQLATLAQVPKPSTTDEWMIAAAKHLDLEKLKYPIIAVQEYGWNIFRLSTHAKLALTSLDHAHVFTNTQVQAVVPIDNAQPVDVTESNDKVSQWCISFKHNSIDSSHPSKQDALQPNTHTLVVDYLINACGFRTGTIDDMIGVEADRMVEFKASYVTHWAQGGGQLPEIIIHGTRGTPEGMMQLTPYPNGYYQIHGMTKDITLFDDGLVKTLGKSSQPVLSPEYLAYIDEGWSPQVLAERSQRAIDFVSDFVPKFASATPTGNALYGGQQIPGEDDTLRVADVSLYRNKRYARAENVKASSSLQAADEIVTELQALGLVQIDEHDKLIRDEHQWSYIHDYNKPTIDNVAKDLAIKRHFPASMAGVNNAVLLKNK